MIIGPDTKIGVILKANPAAIDAIAGINRHFLKLRNPVLRKLLAARVTVREAANIGKCSVSYFLEQLQPLGFQVAAPATERTVPLPGTTAVPLPADASLDVRPDLERGKDPFVRIMAALAALQPGGTLQLINAFEPVPLLRILEGKGYSYTVQPVHESEVHTYITRAAADTTPEKATCDIRNQFDQLYQRHHLQSDSLDVRELPMPQPMITILAALEDLAPGKALQVRHKRVPVYLLPELRDRGFSYAIRELAEEVQLIIVRNPAGQ